MHLCIFVFSHCSYVHTVEPHFASLIWPLCYYGQFFVRNIHTLYDHFLLAHSCYVNKPWTYIACEQSFCCFENELTENRKTAHQRTIVRICWLGKILIYRKLPQPQQHLGQKHVLWDWRRMERCVICDVILVNKNDRNLINGTAAFNPESELNLLNFVVNRQRGKAKYVCRKCCDLSKRRDKLRGDL